MSDDLNHPPGPEAPKVVEAMVATDLTKWFGEGDTKTTAVNGVALAAHFGEMLFIVGPSGSGKTTFLSMISGILRPNSGQVLVKGDDLWAQDSDQLAEFRLNTIGFVFQAYNLLPVLTAVENVEMGLEEAFIAYAGGGKPEAPVFAGGRARHERRA